MVQLSTVRMLIVLVILHIIAFLIERYRYNKFLDEQKRNDVACFPSFWERIIDANMSYFTVFVFAIDITIIFIAVTFWIMYPTANAG